MRRDCHIACACLLFYFAYGKAARLSDKAALCEDELYGLLYLLDKEDLAALTEKFSEICEELALAFDDKGTELRYL